MKCCLAALLCIAVNAAGSPLPVTPPTLPPAPRWLAPVASERVLKNGLRVMWLPMHEVPLVHIAVAVAAGSETDPADQPGVASALAALLASGGAAGKSAEAMRYAFADLGAELHEECDTLGVHFSLTTTAENLDAALQLLADSLIRPSFNEHDWQDVRKLRLGEIAHDHWQPDQLADTLETEAIFGAHPYAHDPLGDATTIGHLSSGALRSFYATHYGPLTTSVIVVGDVPPDLSARAQRVFTGWVSQAVMPSAVALDTSAAPRFLLYDRPGAAQTEVRVGSRAFGVDDKDFPVAQLIDVLLGGSFTSRLMQNLREKRGYTYAVRSQLEGGRGVGMLVVHAAVRNDAVGDALKQINAEIERARVLPTDDDLKKSRALAMSDLVESLSDGTQTERAIAALALSNQPLDTWARSQEAYRVATAQSFARVGKRLFSTPVAIVIVGDAKLLLPQLQAVTLGPIEIVPPR